MTERTIESFIEDAWAAGQGEGVALLNPATEATIAKANTNGLGFGPAIAFARSKGVEGLSALSFEQRGGLIKQMAEALQSIREELIDSAIENGGCTRGDAKFDVDGAIGTLTFYASLARTLGDTRILEDDEGAALGRSPKFWGQHFYVPRPGVAVLVNAFNFPAWGFAEKAACALLAGMPVVTKPATATAATAYLVTKKIVDEKILPSGALSFVAGPAQDLLDHLEEMDVLAFTGSAYTGQKFRARSNVVEKGVRVNIEADSLNAAVLGPDVEVGSDAWHMFVAEVAKDVTQKTGQKCTAIRRIVVPENRVDDVIEQLGERFSDTQIGDPSLKDVRMGPVATAQQRDDVNAGVRRLMEDGDVVFGKPGERPETVGVEGSKGFFVPIVLVKARDSLAAKHVHDHEVFGPVATILPYSGESSEAISIVRLGKGGLVSSVYSDDRKFVESVALGIAPYHGRIYLGSAKVRDQTMGPGTVLPGSVHGGPGRAGAGEELGGMRGVKHFMQRTAIQGYRPLVEKLAK